MISLPTYPSINYSWKFKPILPSSQGKCLFPVYSFPDFSDQCPICGGEDCAILYDFYDRGVVDEHGTYYKGFPLARYKCHSKGIRKVPHSTFSLLPHSLIPYTRYSIPFVMKILEELSLPNSTIGAVIDYVAGLGKNDILSISAIKVRILRFFLIWCGQNRT